ncbi:MAG: neutral/alkaline non-lysosomal ceramidase N-terminal domain-containing protein [Lewinella sp.]|nr:neutral/alkaline non-lysosomal ceramidase N-terminal domain-containing protein [Lewinella sp.]
MRILLKIFVILLILLIICWLVGVDRVDYTPYFETEYYQATMDGLEQEAAQLSLADGPVSIGIAKVNITPVATNGWNNTAEALPLAGYGKREGLPAEGVHDSLYVKVLVMQVKETILAIVGADLLIVPPELVEQTQKKLAPELNLPRAQLFYSATHTHSSVGGWSSHYVGELFAGAPNAGIIDWLAEHFARAIEQAMDDLAPGSIAQGSFAAPDQVYNRLVKELGTELSTFSYLLAQQDKGKQAVIGIFDAHATTLNDENMTYSADYPAYWYEKMESAGIDLPIFCAGSVGSHGPESSGRGFEKARHLGEDLADSLLLHLQSVNRQDTLSLAVMSLPLELPPFQVRISDHWRLAPFLVKKLFPSVGDPYVQSARIGHFIWSTMPADFSGELALIHENRLLTQGFSSTITSFNGAYVGYIVPEKYYYLNEYESRVMSWFGPYMSPYLNEVLLRMTDDLVALR